MKKQPSKWLDAKRRGAIEWAYKLVESKHGFVIFDTETTGLGRNDQVIQIAILKSNGLATQILVRPSVPIQESAALIHGFTDEKLQPHASWDGGAGQHVFNTLRGQTVVAYNMAFDWRVLEQTYAAFNMPRPLPFMQHCAMLYYADFAGVYNWRAKKMRWHKLPEACANLGIPFPPNGYHDALTDCRQTLALIKAMAAAPLTP